MITNHSQFLEAVKEKQLVRIEFYSTPDQGVVDRECAPLGYGPDPAKGEGLNRYLIWDFASPMGSNRLGLLPRQIVKLSVLSKTFDPAALTATSSS